MNPDDIRIFLWEIRNSKPEQLQECLDHFKSNPYGDTIYKEFSEAILIYLDHCLKEKSCNLPNNT